MKHTSLSSYKKSLAALGAGAALTIALTGCLPTGGNADKAGESSPAVQESTASDEATAENNGRGGNDDESTDTSEATDSGATMGASKDAKDDSDGSKEAAPANTGKLTAPGTSLKLGEVAYTHSNSGDKGTEKYKEATYETKVTKIVKGDAADLAKFKDAAKFAGQTPYYVFADVKLTSLNKPSAGIGDPRIQGHLKDGSEAQKLIVFGSIADCDSTSFETEGKDDDFSYVVGSTKVMCNVFLAPSGDAVTTASYDDSSFNYESYKDNKYRDQPIVWKD